MVNGAYESIMAPVVSTFFGTPFAAPLLRLLGCKIGRHCYIGSALFSEFDLVKIGDRVALNSGAVIQNHLFEDRIMKSSFLTIEDGCSVGNMSVVLYDSHMMRGATLGPLSLLMKGEVMPQSFRGHGIPMVQACPGAPSTHDPTMAQPWPRRTKVFFRAYCEDRSAVCADNGTRKNRYQN